MEAHRRPRRGQNPEAWELVSRLGDELAECVEDGREGRLRWKHLGDLCETTWVFEYEWRWWL